MKFLNNLIRRVRKVRLVSGPMNIELIRKPQTEYAGRFYIIKERSKNTLRKELSLMDMSSELRKAPRNYLATNIQETATRITANIGRMNGR